MPKTQIKKNKQTKEHWKWIQPGTRKKRRFSKSGAGLVVYTCSLQFTKIVLKTLKKADREETYMWHFSDLLFVAFPIWLY